MANSLLRKEPLETGRLEREIQDRLRLSATGIVPSRDRLHAVERDEMPSQRLTPSRLLLDGRTRGCL